MLAVLALTSAAALGACGGTQQTKIVTVAATAPAPKTATTTSTSNANPGAASNATAPRPKTTLAACDPNVSIKAATTTCAFAENVFYEYWRSLEYGDVTDIEAFSPALGRFLAIDCDQGDAVKCRTDAGALVRFPQSAVEAYTIHNAARYARGHKVSTEPHPENPAPVPPSGGRGDCDPSYDGACLDASASDYDCEGGSGDGPEYTGTVTVVGDDHFGLDRDGDGIACES